MCIPVIDNVYLSRMVEAQARDKNPCEYEGAHFVTIHDNQAATAHLNQPILVKVINFCDKLQAMLESQNEDSRIIVCPAHCDDHSISDTCFYLGAYMILYKGATCDQVVATFSSDETILHVERCTDLNRTSTLDSWRALYRSMQLGWLVHPDSDCEPVMDVEELAHYAQRANGMVHMTVPGKLFFFPTPEALPSNVQWADFPADDGATIRRFSAHFYADLLEDLGVSVVACLGTGSAATAAALRARGIDAVDLGLAGDGSSLLRGLDALLSLARGAPGAVAVHSGEGFVWPGYVGTLVEAFLISRLGFDEGSAGAWLRMVSPWMHP
jgi:hypothetical protein